MSKYKDFPGGSAVTYLPAMQETHETLVKSLGCEDSLEEAWQRTPVFLPGESPWTEEPGKLQTMGLQWVRQDWLTKHSTEEMQNFLAIYDLPRLDLPSAIFNMPANLENSAVATGLEKVSFHSNTKERQCKRMFKLLHNCTHFTR